MLSLSTVLPLPNQNNNTNNNKNKIKESRDKLVHEIIIFMASRNCSLMKLFF